MQILTKAQKEKLKKEKEKVKYRISQLKHFADTAGQKEGTSRC